MHAIKWHFPVNTPLGQRPESDAFTILQLFETIRTAV